MLKPILVLVFFKPTNLRVSLSVINMYSCDVLCSGLVLCSSIDVVIYLVFTFQQKANNSRGGGARTSIADRRYFFFILGLVFI